MYILFYFSEKKKSREVRVESVDCTPPSYIMPGSRERPLLPLHPVTKDYKGPQCIKVSPRLSYEISYKEIENSVK